MVRYILCGISMWEILVVGGQTPDGKDATNELSYLCLEAANQLKDNSACHGGQSMEGTLRI